MLGRLVRTHHTFPYFIHGARAYSACVFVFLNCTKESPAHAIVPMRTPPPATYAFVPALTITHALAPRAMLLYNVCESLAHKAPIRHNGCKFDPVSAVPWEDV